MDFRKAFDSVSNAQQALLANYGSGYRNIYSQDFIVLELMIPYQLSVMSSLESALGPISIIHIHK